MKGIQNTNTSNFSTVVSNNRRFFVPEFQRDYSWDTEQWDDLWQDIITMTDEHDEHYMGYLVLQTEDEKNFISLTDNSDSLLSYYSFLLPLRILDD